MNPSELEFIGEKSIIGIIPNFNFDPIHLISGSIGPFNAGLPVHVPLWIAVHLKKQQKCRIVPSTWMDVNILTELKDQERLSRYFVKMPSENYMIEAKLVLGVGSEDVPKSEEIRTIIKDIFDMRLAKLRQIIDAYIDGEGATTSLDNLTMFEIHSVRPFLPHSLDLLDRLNRVSSKTAENSLSSNSFAHSSGSYGS